MRNAILSLVLAGVAFGAQSESFEVAAVKPAEPTQGRYMRMQSAHRFIAKNFTLKGLVCAAYNLNPRELSGGPAWTDSESFDVVAGTPGATRPSLDRQMGMLRNLLTERFQLTFHREPREMPYYALTVAKGGPKLRESKSDPDAIPELVNVVYADHVTLPARNATITELVAMMQRAMMDRPVVDRTGLTGRYDFDLEWTPDESQFGGALPKVAGEPVRPGLFTAMQEQLGLKLEPSRGPVEAMVIDRAEHPSEN